MRLAAFRAVSAFGLPAGHQFVEALPPIRSALFGFQGVAHC